MSAVIGIDPGLSGAISVLSSEGRVFGVFDCPSEKIKKGSGKRRFLERQMFDLLENISYGGWGGKTVVCIERYMPMPRQSSPSVAKAAYGVGLWVMAAHALGFRVIMVSPHIWKKHFFKPSKKNSEGKRNKTKDKERSVRLAKKLFPDAKEMLTSHDRAESLLLAKYAMDVMI